ncbi:hypothetical protein B0H11DRAFT_2134690 [Mycena galericulata]|nr:hypothetical protein B0H11DRAFT_2134690 [Mycena galericulata]
MDADGYNSDLAGESQASLVLKNALAPTKNTSMPGLEQNTLPVDEPDISKDSSSDSMNSHPAPLYHYHGLATTQTQSQEYDDESDLNEESQKENVKSSREALSSSGNQVQGVVQSTVPSSKARADNPGRLPSKSTTNTKAVSFQSPKAVTTPIKVAEERSSSRSLRRATPSIKRNLSQDSFAGDFEDPAEKFIASSKQFGVPLAELGRAASPSVELSPRSTRIGAMYTDDHLDGGRVLAPDSDYDESQSQPRSQSQPTSQSQSQGIDKQSDDYNMYETEAHQPEDDRLDILPAMPTSQASTQYPSSGPSSTDMDLYGTQPLEPTQILEPTQLVEEPTQILEATQLVEDYAESPINFNTIEGRGESFSNVTGTTGGHAKTLLDSLDVRKRERYALHLGQISHADPDHTPTNDATYSSSAAHPSGLVLQETQPAFEVPVSPVRSIGRPQQMTGATSRLRRTIVEERTEVIPDSEPLREAFVSPSKPPNKSAAKSRQCPVTSDTETDNEDVAESMAVDGKDADKGPVVLDFDMSRREEEEEDEDEDEEDIPLSATTSKRMGGKQPDLKGKGKAVEMGPPPVKPKRPPVKSNPPKKRKIRAISPEVPSSVPHQDHPAPDPIAPANAKRRTRVKSGATAGAGNSRMPKRGVARNTKNLDESLSETDEEATESADDEYMVAGPSTRKRKRGIKAESPVVSCQLKGRRAVSKASTSTRQTTRRRATSTSTHTTLEPTRVFALWRKDGHFYSGSVHSFIAGEGKYKVKFDDGTEDDVRLDQMRSCAPKLKDFVFVPGVHRAGEIVGLLDDGRVSVEAGILKDVRVSDLRIGARAIETGWSDRALTTDTIVCAVKPPKPLSTPTPSRISVASTSSRTSSRRSSELFAKIGFCITSSTAGDKEVITAQIRNHGGTVFDDWQAVIPMKGKRTTNRWILERKDATPVSRGVQRLFLLSEDASRTTKYLVALALGIPCLRIDFIENAIETNQINDWTSYLLLAGYSDLLKCRVTQFINADWDVHTNLVEAMNDPVCFKVLPRKNVLYVDDDAETTVPCIILSMGADSVENLQELRYASRPLVDYDYIIASPKIYAANERKLRKCTFVLWDSVKDALISRRIEPPEVWNSWTNAGAHSHLRATM